MTETSFLSVEPSRGAHTVEAKRASDRSGVRGDDGAHELEQRSEEHTSELQSPCNLVCRLLLKKKRSQNCSTSTSKEISAAERRSPRESCVCLSASPCKKSRMIRLSSAVSAPDCSRARAMRQKCSLIRIPPMGAICSERSMEPRHAITKSGGEVSRNETGLPWPFSFRALTPSNRAQPSSWSAIACSTCASSWGKSGKEMREARSPDSAA